MSCAGLVRKRALLGVAPAPTLSQLLKEAKSEEASPVVRDGELDSTSNPLNYSRLFDEYHGMPCTCTRGRDEQVWDIWN